MSDDEDMNSERAQVICMLRLGSDTFSPSLVSSQSSCQRSCLSGPNPLFPHPPQE